MGRLDSELEDLYRRRQAAFQVMLASVTASVESASHVVHGAATLRRADAQPGEVGPVGPGVTRQEREPLHRCVGADVEVG